jgi:hypothetical protein
MEAVVRNSRCVSPRPPSWRPRERIRNWVRLSLVISLVRFYLLGPGRGGGQRGTCNEPPSCG